MTLNLPREHICLRSPVDVAYTVSKRARHEGITTLRRQLGLEAIGINETI